MSMQSGIFTFYMSMQITALQYFLGFLLNGRCGSWFWIEFGVGVGFVENCLYLNDPGVFSGLFKMEGFRHFWRSKLNPVLLMITEGNPRFGVEIWRFGVEIWRLQLVVFGILEGPS